MLKTLRVGEFNQFLQEGKAYPKPFPGANLLDGLSIEQISKDVIEIAQRCRNGSIGKVFVSDIVYCTKVRYETIQNLKTIQNTKIYTRDVWSMVSVLLIMKQFRRKIYGRMEYM